MKLTVGRNVSPKPIINAYSIEIEAMQGDADGSKNVVLGNFLADKPSDLDYLEEAIILCQTLLNVNDREDYRDVEGFRIWFSDEIVEGLDENDPRYELSDVWPNDPMTDYQTPCSFRDYKVYFYNEIGQKFIVHVDLNESN